MKKRKQPDFQKVKLKVGRALPKGRNETKTSFQTKKIRLLDQIKETVGEPTLKELLSFMKSTDVKIKYDNLRRLGKYVEVNEDTLCMFFPDILKELGRTLLESDPKVRSEAIIVLGKCAEILSDSQFKPFVVPLTSYLNCMMTHMSIQVRQDSLKFLDVLLNSHPKVMCQSLEILSFLLNMISCKESATGKKGGKSKNGRKLLDVINSKMSADEWRMGVLKQMLTFLKGTVSEKNSSLMVTDDQKEVYWNAKETLYLPLYPNSGTEPAKFDYSLYCSANLGSSDSKDFKKLMQELIGIIFAILKGFNVKKSLSQVNINYLSIITKILCCIGEWSTDIGDLEDDLNITENLRAVCCQLLQGFPYSLQSLPKSAKIEKAECVELNMEISYLYCMCSFLSDNPEKSYLDGWESIKVYIPSVFSVSGAKLNKETISLALKITKVLIQCKNFDESAKNGLLIALHGTLHTNKFSSTANDLYSFFMELSLNHDFRNLLVTSAMREWFQNLIGNLILMMESKEFVPNYLSYIKQVCARRNHHFMLTVNSLDSQKFIELIKFEDEDFQLTVIHLIVSLNEISPDFLQDLAETIRDETFSLKTASRLIRQLHSRFSKPDVSPLDKMNFIKFLLNLALDTFLLLDPSLDTEPLPLTDMLLNHQQSLACQFEIYPTSGFERQQEIFEVCAGCLSFYFKDETYENCLRLFIGGILREPFRFPVHSVVAIIELFKRFTGRFNDGQLHKYLQSFVYSCLVYNSLITKEVPEEHWIEYCVPAVQSCLDVIRPLQIIDYLDSNVLNFDENQLHHVLRIYLLLIQRRDLDGVDKNFLYPLFSKLSEHEVSFKRELRILLQGIYEYLTSI